jgi:hypothetical protein
MPEVLQPPAGGKGRGAPAALNFADAEAVRAWLADVQSQIDDLHAAGEDATRALGRRALGRPTARAAIQDAYRALRTAMESAERGLAP